MPLQCRRTPGAMLPATILLLAGAAIAQTSQPRPEPIPGPVAISEAEAIRNGSPIRDTVVYLAAERIDTAQRIPARELVETALDARVSDRFVIQLDGPITPERRIALRQAGIRLGDYLPANAYVAQFDAPNRARLADLDFVQWHSPFQNAWKIAPDLGRRTFQTVERRAIEAAGRTALVVTLFEGEDPGAAANAIRALAPGAQIHYAQNLGGQGEISLTIDRAMADRLATIDAVQFIEDAPELTFRNATTRWISQSNSAGNLPVYDAGIHGEGEIVAVMDGRPRQDHCSLDDGKFLFYNAPAGSDFHGTHVACTVAGDDQSGNDASNLRGIAWAANMVFDDVPSFTDTAIYNNLQQHHNQGARYHTNSWGDDGTTAYNSMCRGIDRFSHDYEESLVLFAVTNLGSLRNPDNSKNLLAVGASQDSPNQGSHCSGGVGPTADGRRKPEIYLPGCSTVSASSGSTCGTTSLTGTSMACPAVAGACALVGQYYRDGFYPSGAANPSDSLTPSGALVKATVLNSTVDMTGVGGYPSNLEGWGRVLLDDTLHFTGDAGTMFIDDIRNANGLSTGQNVQYNLNVTSNSPRLKITLVWTEPPASASTGSAPAWINDLNLLVTGPDGSYIGNDFSAGQSDLDGLSLDDRNNVEMVLLNTPTPGNYTITVDANAVNDGPQGFALVATGAISLGPAPLSATLASSVPALHPIDTPLDVEVQIGLNDDTLQSIDLHYSADGLGYTTLPMVDQGGDLYAATIPGFESCDDTPSFYVTVTGDLAGTIELPTGGASSPYTYELGSLVTYFQDNAEANLGWSSTGTAAAGLWDRGIPVNASRGDPASDADGSGQAWLTQNDLGPLNDGNSDVDDGVAVLTSAPIDAPSGGTFAYSYWLNDVGTGVLQEDEMIVEYATDAAGTNWVVARTYTTAQGLWRTDAFDVPATSTLRIRFSVSDDDPQNVVEAGVDAMSLTKTQCEDVPPPPVCIADYDSDDDTDVFDFNFFATAFGSTGHPPFTNGDLDGDGDVDVFDFNIFAPEFGCPN